MPNAAKEDFERLMLPHLGAAYSLACWLLRHPQDAEDAVQEATLKAYKAFGTFSGGNARAWLMTIVRNTCLTQMERDRAERKVVVLHDGFQDRATATIVSYPDPAPLADAKLIADIERQRVHDAIAQLPAQFREVLVLREFHDLGYREIADVVGAPVGTVMSRLSRARERLQQALVQQHDMKEAGQKQ